MYIRHTPIAAMHVTRNAVHNPMGKDTSATLTLPPLSWSEPELTPEILPFGVKALFDYANDSAKLPTAS
jgi:hypothetical protein